MEKIEKAYSVNLDTGEANEIIIHKEVDSQNFVKVFMADFLVALGILNSKSVAVVCYILENVKYSDNTLIATKEQIAEGTVFEYLSEASNRNAIWPPAGIWSRTYLGCHYVCGINTAQKIPSGIAMNGVLMPAFVIG